MRTYATPMGREAWGDGPSNLFVNLEAIKLLLSKTGQYDASGKPDDRVSHV